MTAGDTYHVSGGLKGRFAFSWPAVVSDDYIQVDAAAVARVAANDTVGTWTAWINMPNITGTFTVIGAGDKDVVEFFELNVEAGLLTGRCTDATVAQFVTQADAIHFEPHRWYHVAMVQAALGAGVKLYVDGIQIAATNDTATDVNEWFNNLDGIDSMRIGAANKVGDDSVTNDFIGAISDVKIFTDVLTDAEVKNDSKELVNTNNLHNHWDMRDDLTDAGTGADDGTDTGADGLLINNYSEFTSRFKHSAGVPVVADLITIDVDSSNNIGHAVVIKAA